MPIQVEIIIYSYIFILGIVIGSFLNVLIYRLPLGISVSKGRSFCPTCKHMLHAWDLIPLFSFLLQKGKCHYCQTSISWRYPLLEALTGLAFVLVYACFGWQLQTIGYCLMAAILLVIAGIDQDTMMIYDRFHFILMLCAIFLFYGQPVQWGIHLLGSVIVSLPLLLVFYVSKGGIGGGDIKLMAVCGFLLGYQKIVLALLVGSVAGSVYGAWLLLHKKKTKKDMIAFGPYLCAGIYFSALFGQPLITWYMSFL